MSVWPSLECGLVTAHAVPRSLLSRFATSIATLVGGVPEIYWTPLRCHALRTLQVGHTKQDQLFSCRLEFNPSEVQLAELASELSGLRLLWFEASVPTTAHSLGERYCYTPTLGLFHSQLDQAGNQLFGENQILAAIKLASTLESGDLRSKLTDLLGVPWDAELEPLRKSILQAEYLAELAS
jgi:Protein of unknown function (DUF3145)